MRRQQSESRESVSKEGSNGSGIECPKGGRPLSSAEIRELWNGLEVRVVGLFRVSGERSAVAAVTTILGFVMLTLKHFPLETCLLEGALGAGLVWMLIRNAKNKDSP
jgi:hypothetical protein